MVPVTSEQAKATVARTQARVRRFVKRFKLAIEVILLAVGLILILAAAYRQDLSDTPSIVLFGLGTSVMASMLISLLFSITGADSLALLQESFDFNQQAQDMGLKSVLLYHDSGSIKDWLYRATSVDFMANTGRKFVNLCTDELVDSVALHGCKVRILISDDENPMWGQTHVSEGASPNTDIGHELSETIKRLQNLKERMEELNESNRRIMGGSLEVRKYQSIPYCSLLIVDSVYESKVCRYTPYLPHTDSAEVPSFDITSEKNGKLFVRYEKVFDTVWKKAPPIDELAYPPPVVSVEQVPVEGWEASEAEIGEDEVTMPVTEEVVTERRPVVKEGPRIRKDAVQDEEDVRREEVDVEDATERGRREGETPQTAQSERRAEAERPGREEDLIEQANRKLQGQ